MKGNAFIAICAGIATALVLVLGGSTVYLFVENQKLKAEAQQLRVKEAAAEKVQSEFIGDSQTRTCLNNLRLLDSASQQWMLETGGSNPAFSDILKFLPDGLPHCPSGGTYSPSKGSGLPTCSIAGHTLPE